MGNYNNIKDLIHFKGGIWISKSFNTEKRGNICLKNQDTGEFQVLAYISPLEIVNRHFEDVIESNLKALGLLKWLEFEDESVITCSSCGFSFDEGDVNIIDYDLDLCIQCEKEHLHVIK